MRQAPLTITPRHQLSGSPGQKAIKLLCVCVYVSDVDIVVTLSILNVVVCYVMNVQ